MAFVVIFAGRIKETSERRKIRIDALSVVLSALGLIGVVLGMLQSKVWGWIVPLHSPEINGNEIAPLGISLTAWLIVLGVVLLALFFKRQRQLVASGREPLVHVELLSITRLRSGLSVLGAQYAITAGLFFAVPVYLQMTLGLDALQTGIRIFPLSVSLIIFSAVGTRLSQRWSARRIVLIAQWILVASAIVLLAAIDPELSGWAFGTGMFTAGAALGLLASQLGNVNMSAVGEKDTSEVGGLQGVFQNLGSSLGTALIGSILIGALATSFASGVSASALPDEVQALVSEATSEGVEIVPAATVPQIASDAGLTDDQGKELARVYTESQLESLRIAFFGLIALALLSLLASRGIPNDVPLRKLKEPDEPAVAT
jgi:Na+/melibiose symporter-like transporter